MDKTFLKGLTLLELLARSEKPCGVTELAQEMQLTKSNVHRLLQGLVHQGFARNIDGSGRYELTMKLWELGSHVFGRLDVRQIAIPYMEELAAETSETVHLSALEGEDVLYLAKIDSPQPVRAYTTVGGRAPAYCVATGKAQLAWADVATLERVRSKLVPHTSKSPASVELLDQELERIRVSGYALNLGEWREQVCGVAAPIRDASTRVVAAVGISGPAERLRTRVLHNMAPMVIKACDTISSLLGYRPRP